MAQNISLWGATYSNVPAVNLPKSTSGTARFTDTTPTTATASDVASGKVFFLADGSQATGTNSGGGGIDCPIFTMVWGSTPTITCDKTYAECMALINSDDTSALLYIEDGGDTYVEGLNGEVLSSDSSVIYIESYSGMAQRQITYHSDGTLTFETIYTAKTDADITTIKSGSQIIVDVPQGTYLTGAGTEIEVITYYSGTDTPTSSMGNDNDIYLKVVT